MIVYSKIKVQNLKSFVKYSIKRYDLTVTKENLELS